MKRLSSLAAIGLSLALSPLGVSPAAADLSGGPSSRLPVTKALSFVHRDDEAGCIDRSLAAQARGGAFLEMTSAAP